MGKTLVSWLGAADLLSVAADLPKAEKKRVLKDIERKERTGLRQLGPVRTLMEQVEFDTIHLLNNYSDYCADQYLSWLEKNSVFQSEKVELQVLKVDPPTDYTQVFEAADKALKKITAKLGGSQLCFHLSPGTPTMVATMLLLGKSRYPADFYQTYRGKVIEAKIPFDLIVDFLPEVFEERNFAFQNLLNAAPADLAGFESIIGDSPGMIQAKTEASQTALMGEFNVLITGESGTGKELFARAIHNHSRRQGKKFIPINCAAISTNLIESELFGHVKGAFTDASEDKQGAFSHADGGTLFLDEIGACDPKMQAILLRVLETEKGKGQCCRKFNPVGKSESDESDVRIIAATNQNLSRAIQEKIFREDLFYRLAEIPLHLPPLRERRKDIPKLVEFLLKDINKKCRATNHQHEDKTISKAALSQAQREGWPGNVRQLHNALVRATVMGAGKTIERSMLEKAIIHLVVERDPNVLGRPLDDGFDLQAVLDEVSIHYIERAKDKSKFTKSIAAGMLGFKSATSLDNWLKRLGLGTDWKG